MSHLKLPTAQCPVGFEVCDEVYQIINGLPPGDTIDIEAVLTPIVCALSSVCCG